MELVFTEGVTLAQNLDVSGRKSRNSGTWSPALQFARWGGGWGGQRNKDQREEQICLSSIHLKKDQLGAGHIMPTITLADWF